MRRKFDINISILRKVFRENAYVLIGIILACPIFGYFKGVNFMSLDSSIIIILLGLLLLLNTPVVILLVDYYLENVNMSLVISREENLIIVERNSETKEYKFSDVENSVYHLGAYYKNRIDQAGRWKMTSSDFGYWEIAFNNGDRYYITNLLVDFLHKEPIVRNTTYTYRMLQTINKSDSREALEQKQKKFDNRVAIYTRKYRNKSYNELLDMEQNESRFEKEAVHAVRLLLKKKNNG